MATDVATQIANADAVADAAETDLRALIDTAQAAASGYSTTGPAITVTAPSINAPPFNPNTDLSASFQTDFDATWSDLEVWIRGLMTDWMNTYFPILDPALGTAEDAWLLSVINSGYSGIPVALEQAIWDRARGKDTLEALRMEEESASQLSTRGFSTPPGLLYDRLLQVQQSAANKSSTIARELAIKQMEIAVDMVKFAVGEVTKLRIGIAAALADFIRAWMAMPTAAADIARAKSLMHQALWNSSADYIRAQVAIGQLSLDAQKTNALVNVDMQRLDTSLWTEHNKMRVEAALRAADNLGKVATGARSAQNTLVGAIETTSL